MVDELKEPESRAEARRFSPLAVDVLREIMVDYHAPAQTRAQAATTILQVAGLLQSQSYGGQSG